MRLLTTALTLLAFSTAALAQEIRRPLPAVLGAAPPSAVPPEMVAGGAYSADGLWHQVLNAASGALVGAWVGYLASQVAVGDWDDEPIQRGNWAAGGAALGVTAGLTIPTGPVRPGPAVEAPRRPDRNVLTTDEIRNAQAGSLYEVIRSLRPEWLRTRGTGSIRETPRGSSRGRDLDVQVRRGIATIKVYLDGSYLGALPSLRNIDPGLIGEARYLTSAEATQRWGAGHLHGAILVITAPSS